MQYAALMCEKCGSWYNSSATLAVHRATHHHTTRFQCDQCDRTFGFRCFLEKHIRVDHQHERLSCQLCDKTFKYSQDLKIDLCIHQTKEHPDNKSVGKLKPIYICEHCGKEFITKGNLTAHSYIHEEVYRFACQLCSQSFKQYAGLRHHMINAHKLTKVPVSAEDCVENVQPLS
uniref:C2H2-type domain-containing protein n=1 Tax=Anopheles epiroticus TaxID=199890 RepID=A0A182PMC1_9DIPT